MRIRIFIDLPIPISQLDKRINDAKKILIDNGFEFEEVMKYNKEGTELYIEGTKND